MSDRYKNEPFNTPEQKAYEKALNKIRELEVQLTEKEALLKDAKEMAEFYADPSSWREINDWEHIIDDSDEDFVMGIGHKGGKRAREFLAKLKAGEK